MQLHGPKRIYTPRSLESWFARLEFPWEDAFSPAQLDEGRRIYRDGEIREVELGVGDAIVHRKVDRADEYAVIEWKDGRLSVRQSMEDAERGRAIAVAGLLEIEELIADEITPLPTDANGTPGHANGSDTLAAPDNSTAGTDRPPPASPNGTATGAHPSGNGHASRRPAPPPTSAASPQPIRSTAATPATHARQLLLRFEGREAGLVFTAFWSNGTAAPPVPVAVPGRPETHGRDLPERRQLIALAAAAKRARFRYEAPTREYLLSDLRQVPEFVRRSLPEWRKQFRIECGTDVEILGTGPRQVTLRAELRASADGGGLDLRWIFEAGGRMLTAAEAARLRGQPGAAVLMPGVGLVALGQDRAAGIERWSRSVADMPEGTLPHYLVFSLFQSDLGQLRLDPAVEGWKQRLRLPAPALPGLPELLRPYQRRGVEWLAHLCEHGCHGLLADEMGLGKTLQVLSLIATRAITDAPNLIVCPASVIPVWRDEIQRHFPHIEVELLKGHRTFADVHRPVVWLTSYAQLRRQRPLLDVVEFGYAVLDEAQFIKNPDAKVTQSCFAIRARHRIALTGTPLENRQLDLWSLFRFLMPGFLGAREHFERSLLEDRERTLVAMRTQLAPFLLRRTKDEVASELPQKVQVDLACPLSDTQRLEYARICAEGMARLGPDLQAALRERSFSVFSLLTRLRQVCCDPALLPWVRSSPGESGKVTVLVERLAEVFASGSKVVIFSQFVSLLKRVEAAMEAAFPGIARFSITGGTIDRRRPVQQFQEGAGPAAMLVSLRAAGTGITLHAADYVFLLDPWWNPAVEEQAIDRVHRIGQRRTVFVYRLIAPGTIEERIQALKATKRELFRQVLDGIPTGLDLASHFDSLESLIRLAEEPEAADA